MGAARNLAALAAERPWPRVAFFCQRCANSLGRYAIEAEPNGELRPWPASGRAAADSRTAFEKQGDPRVTWDTFHGRGQVRWRCSCGAEGRRRADRLGALPVDERREPPRVVI